jgi:hypothetical protein
MEDSIFPVSPQPTKTLKEVLREEGRTQVWLMKELNAYGISRDPSQISQYCNGKAKPKDEYVIRVMAEVIGVEFEIINNCFN